jgi:NAD(P)-dependent dehydrogenase (short-subunit alcohol dehydrogenase family)
LTASPAHRPAYYLGRPAAQWIEAFSGRPRPVRQRRAAVVTGGGRGLGRLIAESLAREGIAVGLIARSRADLEESVEHIRAGGGVAAWAAADVSDERAAAAAIDCLCRRLGPVELLVNNAGIAGPAGALWEVDGGEWWRALEVNLKGTLSCTRLALPDMVGRGSGRIVNITSQAGVFRWPNVSAYSVSKAAVVKLTENLAWETRNRGVSVFSVHPGLLPIGLTEVALSGAPTGNRAEAAIADWTRGELTAGRGTDPARAVELVVRLLLGPYTALSGRHLSVHDDVDALLERIDEIRARDLYLLGMRQLAA